jgi:hypothetical protein
MAILDDTIRDLDNASSMPSVCRLFAKRSTWGLTGVFGNLIYEPGSRPTRFVPNHLSAIGDTMWLHYVLIAPLPCWLVSSATTSKINALVEVALSLDGAPHDKPLLLTIPPFSTLEEFLDLWPTMKETRYLCGPVTSMRRRQRTEINRYHDFSMLGYYAERVGRSALLKRFKGKAVRDCVKVLRDENRSARLAGKRVPHRANRTQSKRKPLPAKSRGTKVRRQEHSCIDTKRTAPVRAVNLGKTIPKLLKGRELGRVLGNKGPNQLKAQFSGVTAQ